ncbi:ABC transporter ATP-binding protein [Pseudomonas typographi]|uniref:ABC transporter ATP-binding protein n=1 Tax=Pseudomonas typographi TaxID=2715964 RepID=A0ABR7YYD4_9PSED|nr:ABC transporter ATP-binding protein [Pseudomonas typographi]MBD1550746.1 ABC transporter ATP-binding protein [Pseudomonas typographi]MBD1587688.1 ABC transporter ATP-binding protein [Pseudomonas typographi]MBD1598211.1 ABC transporter ATP-binding protein [Pseudomonas typographi]
MSAGIRFEHVSKAYPSKAGARGRAVLDNFSYNIASGSLVAFVGASGVGKSTLLHLLAKLDTPDAGSIHWPANPAGSARLGVAFQQPRLLDWLSVRDNITLVLPAGADTQQVDELLEAVGLAEHASAFPQTLSGGQRQRVSLARAFVVNPSILLLDEPFSALDELTARRLRLLLQALWAKRSPTGVLVTHNMQEAVFLADKVVILKGRPAQIAEVIEVDIPKPRNPEDPALFAYYTQIMQSLT